MRTADTIRGEFIAFFKSKDHRFVPSAPVVPQDDPTLLFTNAGMNQFKAIFLGENKEGLKRVANSQKCMRVSGKHNDLEEVGVDHYHHTFFEMLGNWSFGDYYKKEAIAWAWELFTQVWNLPKDRLYATVYKKDGEAENFWKTITDIEHSHISRHGEKDNFWEMGETGPCGPCTEIHLDTGRCSHDKEPGHACAVNASGCDRFMELWNLVFIQYNREKDGTLVELSAKHVDTGMGFERIVRVLQGRQSNYDTDVFTPIIAEVESLSGKKYSFGAEGIPFRVIADHLRALVFSITDGAFPSNDGRGYVLRRLLRRAYRFGKKLGFTGPFVYKLVPTVARIMGEAFPEVAKRVDFVASVIRGEEERFDQTLEQGLEKINAIIARCAAAGTRQMAGADVFLLYDTYGFPMDLTRLIAAEQGLSIDEEGFEKSMASQRTRARDAAKAGSDEGFSAENWVGLSRAAGTEFVGYTDDEASVRVMRYKIIEPAEGTDVWTRALVVLDKTPFYAEMGGQAGDTGVLISLDGTRTMVADTVKWNDMTVHKIEAPSGGTASFFTGMLTARIDSARREAVRRNHSATHLLQAALRAVVGGHVSQSGSWVGPGFLRFDFTHFKALTKEEKTRVEDTVNEWILADLPVLSEVKAADQAKKEGAIALFGEKYGDTVRVVSMGAVSKELCGGTHARSTGSIGLFHIVSEASIAAGVRRIEALTGTNSLSLLRAKEEIVAQLMGMLKVNEENVVSRVNDTCARIKALETENNALSQAAAADEVKAVIQKANNNLLGTIRWAAVNLGAVDRKKFTLLTDLISDAIKVQKLDTLVIFLAAAVDGKAQFAACAGNASVKNSGIHCGDLVKAAAAQAQGGGGGSPHRAQAGGKDPARLAQAVAAVEALIRKKAGIS